MRILALDVGDKRTGVALSDPLGILATPFVVLVHQDEASDIEAVLKIVREKSVQKIIVGLPQSLNGSLGAQAAKVQSFTGKLKERSPVALEFRDERLTTVSARRLVREAGTRKSGQKIELDAMAAAVILQAYLDEHQTLAPPE
jgi:putative Holliday junction resolvase